LIECILGECIGACLSEKAIFHLCGKTFHSCDDGLVLDVVCAEGGGAGRVGKMVDGRDARCDCAVGFRAGNGGIGGTGGLVVIVGAKLEGRIRFRGVYMKYGRGNVRFRGPWSSLLDDFLDCLCTLSLGIVSVG
jgi:hypothetical protein